MESAPRELKRRNNETCENLADSELLPRYGYIVSTKTAIRGFNDFCWGLLLRLVGYQVYICVACIQRLDFAYKVGFRVVYGQVDHKRRSLPIKSKFALNDSTSGLGG